MFWRISMIWVDNQGQIPAGSIVARPEVAGRHWALWATGTKGNDNNTYAFVAASNFTHGTVDTLAMLTWLVHHGWIPASSGVSDDELDSKYVQPAATSPTWPSPATA